MTARLSDRDRFDRAISEAQVQRTITDALETYGFILFHDKDSRLNQAGFPDIIAIHGLRAWLVALEVKTQLGRLRPSQRPWLAAFGDFDPDGVPDVFLHVDEQLQRIVGIVRPSNLDEVLAAIKKAAGR